MKRVIDLQGEPPRPGPLWRGLTTRESRMEAHVSRCVLRILSAFVERKQYKCDWVGVSAGRREAFAGPY